MDLREIVERFRQEGNTQASLVVERVLQLENIPEGELTAAGEDLISLCVLVSIIATE